MEHAHIGPACPFDLSHTHPRNYSERTGRCQRGETEAVFCLLQVGDYTGADVDNWPALEKTLFVQYFIICSVFPAKNEMFAPEVSLCCAKGPAGRMRLGCVMEVKTTLIHSPFLVLLTFILPHTGKSLLSVKKKSGSVHTQSHFYTCSLRNMQIIIIFLIHFSLGQVLEAQGCNSTCVTVMHDVRDLLVFHFL